MRLYFSRQDKDKKQVWQLGNLHVISNNHMIFYADKPFTCILNTGEFSGDVLELNIDKWFMDFNQLTIQGYVRVGGKNQDNNRFGVDAYSFYQTIPAE